MASQIAINYAASSFTSSAFVSVDIWDSHAIAVKLEQRISNAIQKWLRLYSFPTNICLCSFLSACPLPIKTLTSIAKATMLSGQLFFKSQMILFYLLHLSEKQAATDVVTDAETRPDF